MEEEEEEEEGKFPLAAAFVLAADAMNVRHAKTQL